MLRFKINRYEKGSKSKRKSPFGGGTEPAGRSFYLWCPRGRRYKTIDLLEFFKDTLVKLAARKPDASVTKALPEEGLSYRGVESEALHQRPRSGN
jgi:hypothetical protein